MLYPDGAYRAAQLSAEEHTICRQVTVFALLAVEFSAVATEFGSSVTGKEAADLERICRRQVAALSGEMRRVWG